MNINDILILCNAGFTAEQIGKMIAVQPEDTPAEPDKNGKDEITDPAPASDIADLAAAIADLKQTIVNSNITNSNQPAPKVDTVESIINNMIGGNK